MPDNRILILRDKRNCGISALSQGLDKTGFCLFFEAGRNDMMYGVNILLLLFSDNNRRFHDVLDIKRAKTIQLIFIPKSAIFPYDKSLSRPKKEACLAQAKDNRYLAGKLLLAMPNMGDPRFHRAVIFMLSHNQNGAMGLVVNHTLPGVAFSELIDQLKIESDIKVDFKKLGLPVMSGGPVEAARGFLLHSLDFRRKETVSIDEGYGITGTVEALKDIAGGKGPDHLLFILGYAGWTAGQLDREIQENAWLVVDPDPAIIFHDKPEEKWQMAIKRLGVDPGMLSGAAGSA